MNKLRGPLLILLGCVVVGYAIGAAIVEYFLSR